MLLNSEGGLRTHSAIVSLTLTQVREWDTEHLTSAAHHWSATANRWDDVFAQLEQLTHSPGGMRGRVLPLALRRIAPTRIGGA